MAEISEFFPGDLIFSAGEPCNFFYVLLSGTAGLWSGDQKILQMKSSHVLGVEFKEPSGSLVYSYTAIAESHMRVRQYPYASLGDLLENARFARMACASLYRQSKLQLELVNRCGEEENVHYSGEIRSYGPGETVIREGDDSTDIFRVVSTDKGLNVVKNEQQLAVIREPGEFFGEMAALLREPRTASVISAGMSVLEVYPSEQLREILKDYPDMSLRMIQNMAKRLAETSDRLVGGNT